VRDTELKTQELALRLFAECVWARFRMTTGIIWSISRRPLRSASAGARAGENEGNQTLSNFGGALEAAAALPYSPAIWQVTELLVDLASKRFRNDHTLLWEDRAILPDAYLGVLIPLEVARPRLSEHFLPFLLGVADGEIVECSLPEI
jgi:hypothetical protein